MALFSKNKSRFKFNNKKDHDYPKSDDEWVAFINGNHDDAIRCRQPFELEWSRNISYYFGFQNLRFNPTTNSIVNGLHSGDEYVINRFATFVDSRISKLTRHRPQLHVAPEKAEREFVKAAELSTELLLHLRKVLRKEDKEQTCALLLTLTGNAFKKIIWNPTAGESLREQKTGPNEEIMYDKNGNIEEEDIFLGEIESHVKSPFNLIASPGTRKINDAYNVWTMERNHIPLTLAKMNYPKLDADNVVMGRSFTPYESFVEKLGSPVFGTFVKGSEIAAQIKEHEFVLVKEFWMRPVPEYPGGVLAVVVGNQLVEFGPWPYEDLIEKRIYPYVQLFEKENPFGFYGYSTASRLVPIQRQYNKARTQLAKNMDLMANSKWLVAKGSGLADNSLTDESGEIVEYNPNLPKPEQARIMPLPEYVGSGIGNDIADFDAVAGHRSAEQLPFQGITAGVALETAAQLSEEVIIPIIRGIERAYIHEGWIELMYANRYYSDFRKIKIFGENEAVRILEFNNADLMHQTDVRVQIESALGHTKAAQQQKILDLWDRRIIVDPQLFLKAFMSGDLNIILKQGNAVENKSVENIMMVKEGKMPPIAQFDNHVEGIKAMGQFIQSPEFRRMPEDRQNIALQVMAVHIQFLQPQLQQQQDQNPAAVGTPSGSQVTEGA